MRMVSNAQTFPTQTGDAIITANSAGNQKAEIPTDAMFQRLYEVRILP